MAAREPAETLALRALEWLIAQEGQRRAFLQATGVAPADLARGLGDAALLAAVLDFVLAEDARVLACAAALGLPPQDLAAARRALPGGDVPHWT